MNSKKFIDGLILRFSMVLMATLICGFAFISCDTAMEMADEVMQPTQPTQPETTTPPPSTEETTTEETTTEDEEELSDLPDTTGDEEELSDLPDTTEEDDNQGSTPPGFENDPNVDPQGLEWSLKVLCSIGTSQVSQFWFCFTMKIVSSFNRWKMIMLFISRGLRQVCVCRIFCVHDKAH